MLQYQDSDLKLKKWQEQLEFLMRQAQHLMHVDDVFWQVHAIIRENPGLNRSDIFQDWLVTCYVCRVLVGLRALVDKRRDTVSFTRVLQDIAHFASDVITRERYRSFYPQHTRLMADRDFNALLGPQYEALDHMPKNRVQEDVQLLEEAMAPLTAYTNEYVTHLKLQPSAAALTYNALRVCLSTVASVLSRYYRIVTGRTRISNVPVIQTDWLSAFEFSWLPPGTKVPEYVHLDNIPPRK